MKNVIKVVTIVIIISLAYSFIRYNIVRSVPLENFPLFIANKAIALSATILIGLSFFLGPLARFWPKLFSSNLYLRKYLGLIGFGVAALHVLMSLVTLSPSYYPKFYTEGGKLNLIGESSLVFGILAFIIFSVICITSLPSIENILKPSSWKLVQRFGYIAYFLVLLHVLIMSYQGWSRAESWQYGLAPISLISALSIVFVLLMRILVISLIKK